MDNEFKINYDQEAVKRKTENSIREESYSKGIEQGIKQDKIEIARMMISDNKPIDEIIKYTGFTINEINNLK